MTDDQTPTGTPDTPPEPVEPASTPESSGSASESTSESAPPVAPQWSVPPPVGTEGLPAVAKKKRPWFLQIRVIIVAVIVIAAGVGWLLTRDEKSLAELKVGNCINIPDGGTFANVKAVSCSEDHDAEVVAKLSDVSTLAIPNLGDDGSLSGSESEADRACGAAALEYVGPNPPNIDNLAVNYLQPDSAGISHDIVCIVETFDGTPLDSSLEGTGNE